MDISSQTTADTLLLEVLKLEGKLMALQQINGLTTSQALTLITSEPLKAMKLSHAVSAMSTECPDDSSSTEAMGNAENDGDAEEDASSVSSEDD